MDIPLIPGAVPLGEKINIHLQSDLGLASALTKNAMIKHLNQQKRKLTSYEPISFLSEVKTDNLLEKSFPLNIKCPNWISIQVKPEITIKPMSFSHGHKIVAMSFNFWTKNLITATVSELIANGIDIKSLYVTTLKTSEDERFRQKNEVIGRAVDVQNGIIKLDATKDPGTTSLPADSAFIESRKENLLHCLQSLFPNDFSRIKQNLESELAKFRSGPTKIIRINALAAYFNKLNLEICPGVIVSTGQIYEQNKTPHFPKIDVLPKPLYVFDPSRLRTHSYHDRGLDQHGPYDRATFNTPTPKVAVICQASKKGQVEQFIRKFCDGMPNVTNKKGFAPYGKGFVRKYCTNQWNIEFYTTNSAEVNAYAKTSKEVIEAASISGQRWNLVLIQIEDGFRTLPAELNPYLVTKAAFLSQGIVTQDFTIETISKQGTQLAYTLNQMALATYAKLGGIPWLLSASPGVSHELIFGLGSASIGHDRLGSRDRIVGITTVFKGDGDYVLENRSKAVLYEDYPAQVETSLRTTFSTLKQRYNWQTGESVRLIFHSFKPFKNVEVDAVKTLMNEIAKDFKLEYAFLHVIENHPYVLIDRNQAGVKDFESGKIKGINAPTRGHYIELNKYECLVTLVGAMEVKKAEDGLPAPLLLRLHRGSTFTDMTYLSRQLFFLANHSWRTFMPSSMPITITYSELIAKLLGELTHIPKWNPDSMLGPIGSSRWFL